jgi:glutamate/tyrosine decarboxylase-like PLP-dependent enzyme
MTAMVAARHAALQRGAEITDLTVYTTAQAHSSVIRAAWTAGISRENVRTVAMDDAFRMKPDSLESLVDRDRANGFTPCAVVASAGTTNTGAVDPLHSIADFCQINDVWLHVDAAYAGFAVLTPEGKRLLTGIERADSLTMDPHKWLFVPFECGCLMVRDPSLLTAAFRIQPEYLRDVEAREEEVNFADRGVQLTRYSRAMKIWMSVNYFGTDAIAAEIQAAMDRARFFEEMVRASPDFEVLSPAQFGIVCFRARSEEMDDDAADELNSRINARVVAGGRYLISSTRLRDRFSLRICTLGFRTTVDDLRGLFESLV